MFVGHLFKFGADLIGTGFLELPLFLELGGHTFGFFLAAEGLGSEVIAAGVDGLHCLAFPFLGFLEFIFVLFFETFLVGDGNGNLFFASLMLWPISRMDWLRIFSGSSILSSAALAFDLKMVEIRDKMPIMYYSLKIE
jgi:hypothetical protein